MGGCSRRRAAHLFALYSAFTASLKPLPKEKVGTIVAARGRRRRRQRNAGMYDTVGPVPVRGGQRRVPIVTGALRVGRGGDAAIRAVPRGCRSSGAQAAQVVRAVVAAAGQAAAWRGARTGELHLLARLRVAPLAGRALLGVEGAEADERDAVAVGDRLDDDVERGPEHRGGRLLRDARLLADRVDELALRHRGHGDAGARAPALRGQSRERRRGRGRRREQSSARAVRGGALRARRGGRQQRLHAAAEHGKHSEKNTLHAKLGRARGQAAAMELRRAAIAVGRMSGWRAWRLEGVEHHR